jgi:hypothetical protein
MEFCVPFSNRHAVPEKVGLLLLPDDTKLIAETPIGIDRRRYWGVCSKPLAWITSAKNLKVNIWRLMLPVSILAPDLESIFAEIVINPIARTLKELIKS